MGMSRRRLLTPVTWPVLSFLLVIVLGGLVLCLPCCSRDAALQPVDAFFLATSAVCVTGLSPVDISSLLTPLGQGVLLALVQVGGLGVMTYTSLVFLLWRHHVPFGSREAVSQALLGGGFDLGSLLRHLVGIVLTVEAGAALALYRHDPVAFSPFSAIFHAVSAFCNAGFALYPDNLMGFRDDLVVNGIICACIILGGVGFGVLYELLGWLTRGQLGSGEARFSRFSRLVVATSCFLILAGGLLLWLIGWRRPGNEAVVGEGLALLLSSFFQSISARTAGFNTVDIACLSHAGLLVLMVLMFIGGGPGSCAGGIKVTTFRVLLGYLLSQLRGGDQIVLANRGVKDENLTRALTLFFLYCFTIMVSVFLLSITESGILHRTADRGISFVHLLFEVVSALGTVGLSANVTPQLSFEGKVIIMLNMFAGRVGLLGILLALRSLQPRRAYRHAECELPIG